MKKIRAAVIGTGYLGRFHAQKYATLESSDLVAIAEINREQGERVADELNTRWVEDYTTLVGEVDAVSIVVPTQLHHEVAGFFLDHGIHVLLEKPITVTVEQAEELIERGEKNGALLQVGHLERFNPAVQALSSVLEEPLFIESHRLAPFNPRGADVSVILDLMIHDIDIIQELVNSPIRRISPIGVPVLTDETDISNARVEFENGCVANVTASRVSTKSERKMRVFQQNAYIVVDFQERTLAVYHKGDYSEQIGDLSAVQADLSTFESGDALMEEIKAFLHSIQSGERPLVRGEEGKRALETALRINEEIINRPLSVGREHKGDS